MPTETAVTEESSESIRTHIQSRRFSARMKRSLLCVLSGASYRDAARSEGIDPATLHRAAGTVPGLRRAHLIAWRERWGDSFPPSWEHHVRELDEAG
jgi:hypothetical protein